MSSISAGTTSTTTLIHSGDTTGSLVFKTNDTGSGGTTAVTIDTSQNVGIGTSSPASKLDINTGSSTGTTDMITLGGLDNASTKQTYGVIQMGIENNTASSEQGNILLQTVESGTVRTRININGSGYQAFSNGGSERMRITSGGDLFLNTTSTFSYANGKMCINADGSGNPCLVVGVNSTSTAYNNIVLGNSTGSVGRIQTNGSATSYLTSSDHRLKSNATTIQNALATVARLNPVTFTWTVDNRQDAGFLAHEFQEVLPNYADGTKDEVDSEGNPVYQAVDNSGAIPYLVKAIQELKAINDQQAETINALTARLVALESK